MDGSENDSRYETKAFSVNEQGFNTSIRLKVPSRSPAMHSRVISQSGVDRNEVDGDDEEIGDKVDKIGGVRMIGKDNYDDEDEDDVSDDDEDDDEAEGNEDINKSDNNNGIGLPQKKRKLKDSISNYELVPRVRTPPAQVAAKSEQCSSSVGRVIGANWSDRESFALLDAWGDRFLKLGRKSLSSEDWRDVADKVSQETSVERTDSQCRNRLDVLKKRYRKEKASLITSGGDVSNWVFFRRMDFLLCSPAQRPSSLSCGVDSGGYVFVNPKVYLNRANGLDEMRDSPENSESSKNGQDDSRGAASKGKRKKGRKGDGCFQLLADSIQKFSDIYEDIEINRRKQMVDLENMRMDFQRQIETQTRQILERAQAEIVRLRREGGAIADENGASAENCSK